MSDSPSLTAFLSALTALTENERTATGLNFLRQLGTVREAPASEDFGEPSRLRFMDLFSALATLFVDETYAQRGRDWDAELQGLTVDPADGTSDDVGGV